MTAVLLCFWVLPQIGFASFRNLTSSFGEVYDPICTETSWASFIDFQKFQKYIIWFSDFSDSRPKKIGCGCPGTFLAFFYVQKINDLFTIFAISHKFWKMFHKSFSYEPSRQYGISPFSKTIIKKKLIVTGVSGKSGLFLLNCLLNCLLN